MQNYSVMAILPYFLKDFSYRSILMMAGYKSMIFNEFAPVPGCGFKEKFLFIGYLH